MVDHLFFRDRMKKAHRVMAAQLIDVSGDFVKGPLLVTTTQLTRVGILGCAVSCKWYVHSEDISRVAQYFMDKPAEPRKGGEDDD